MGSSIITEKTFAFTLSIIAIVLIWWLLNRNKKKVQVVLFGSSKNKYIVNMLTGITNECEKHNISLSVTLVEDIGTNIKAYHDAIINSESSLLICRIYNKETLDIMDKHNKKCIAMSWNDNHLHQLYQETSIARVIAPQQYIFEDDAVIVVPTTDFPKIETKGGIIALDQVTGKELEAIVTLARVYDLKSLYLFGDFPGIDDEMVQTSLRSIFRKIRMVSIPGGQEGELAMKEYFSLTNILLNI